MFVLFAKEVPFIYIYNTSPNIQRRLETMISSIPQPRPGPRAAQGFSKAAMQSKGALDHPLPRMNPCHGLPWHLLKAMPKNNSYCLVKK
jgi:hypothetical protein